ncbi:hypothetical protein GCM10011332_24160 [Terasakiella brassicae]|uniref:Uncharacterized protein n=1 Tax=Terasakiella brassicae TaxID=1634917 RepID=A0A917FE38_9PROT|nr:hypothetical protein [Terasakiella brassicae]GGF69142.1 hypothetical protein GCM10011332_24160 [Terasakiella brassicae]
MNLTNRTSNLLLLFFSIAISLAFLEGALQLLYGTSTRSDDFVWSCDKNDAYIEENECFGRFDNFAYTRYYSKAGYRPLENWKGRGVRINDIGIRSDMTRQELSSINLTLFSGGSTAFGAGVKQADIYSNFVPNAETAGVGGYLFANEFDFIKDYLTDTLKPKVWVALSGWNDVYAAYRGFDYYTSPDMLSVQRALYTANILYRNAYIPKVIQAQTTITPEKFSIKLVYVAAKIAELSGLISVPNTTLQSNDFSYEQFWFRFKNEILTAKHFADLNQIKFVFALQPSLYVTKKELSSNEQKLLETYNKLFPNLDVHFKKFYPRLEKDLSDLSQQYDFPFINTDLALEDVKESAFVDHVHFGSIGNKALGLFLKKQLLDPVPIK